MVIHVGPEYGLQTLILVERLSGERTVNEHDFKFTKLIDVRYVPLKKSGV